MSRKSPCLLVRSAGPLTTVQDPGRRGWRRFGVPTGGVMDQVSAALANFLVGNPPDAAVLEFMLWGGTFEVVADSCRLAITGGLFPISAAGQWMASNRSFRLRRGDLLRIDHTPNAAWGYLAVAGGISVPPFLGSFATHVPSKLGGLNGRALLQDDELPLALSSAAHGLDRALYRRNRPLDAPIRVILGPQDDMFDPTTVELFLQSAWRVTHQANRMGYRLEGPSLDAAQGATFVSDGMMPGSIQVPGSGQPIVLLRDGPSTGGYLKIACIISADLDTIAQRGPGSWIRFQAVTLEEAQRLHEVYLADLDRMPQRLRELPQSDGITPALEFAHGL